MKEKMRFQWWWCWWWWCFFGFQEILPFYVTPWIVNEKKFSCFQTETPKYHVYIYMCTHINAISSAAWFLRYSRVAHCQWYCLNNAQKTKTQWSDNHKLHLKWVRLFDSPFFLALPYLYSLFLAPHSSMKFLTSKQMNKLANVLTSNNSVDRKANEYCAQANNVKVKVCGNKVFFSNWWRKGIQLEREQRFTV